MYVYTVLVRGTKQILLLYYFNNSLLLILALLLLSRIFNAGFTYECTSFISE